MDLRKKQRVVLEALEDIKGRDIVVFNTARMRDVRARVAERRPTRQVSARDRVRSRNARAVPGCRGRRERLSWCCRSPRRSRALAHHASARC